MSAFYVNLVAINPKYEELRTVPVRALVDTGAELSWIPTDMLTRANIIPRRKRTFRAADGRVLMRDVGFCILTAEGYETVDEVVFAEPEDLCLLGVHTLEGFGVMVDAIGHRFLSVPSIVASHVVLPESDAA